MFRLKNLRLSSLLRGNFFPPVPVAIVMVFLIVPALFGSYLAPHDPLSGVLTSRLQPPFWIDGGSAEYLLGTDRLGRDIFSRIIVGSRISAIVAGVGVAISAVIGTVAGLLAAYYGGLVDSLISRLVDVTLAFPSILFGLVLAAIFGPSFVTVVAVIVFIIWAFFARQVRNEGLALMKRDFVAQARVTGQSAFRIMYFHLLPNIAGTIVVVSTLQFGYVIVLESTLSFLGVGLPRPTPAWGLMVSDGRDLIASAWWVALFPGAVLTVSVLGINLWGDRLSDAFDPKRVR